MPVLKNPSTEFHAHGAGVVLFRWLEGKEIPPQECMIVGPAGTGKSLNVGKFLWAFLDRWPRAKVLVLRKTRVSLNESWLDTFESEVLWPGHPSIGDKSREHRTKYVHPNGGELILGGMDQGRRLFSTQYHIIFANELTEFTEQEWMSLHRALRRPGGPGWHLLLGDANPDAEFHWAHRRFPDPMPHGRRRARVAGRERILSWHADNPAITKDYIDRLDHQMVGHMHDRLFKGLWRTASGLIFGGYNPFVHLQSGRLVWPRDAFGKPIRGEGATLELPDLGWAANLTWFGAGMDFGHTSPGSIQVVGHDAEKRGFRVAEAYHTKKDLEWWADWVADLWAIYRMRFLSCDSADGSSTGPGAIERLNDHLADRGVPRIARPVKKPRRKLSQLNAVREALRPRVQDGFPSLVLLRDALVHKPDRSLLDAKLPICLHEEITSLVVKSPRETERGEVQFEEEDPACPNHACDGLGYELLEAWKKDLAKRKPEVTRLAQDTHLALAESAYDLAKREKRERRRRRA